MPIESGPGVRVREVHPEVAFAVLAGGGQRGHGLVHCEARLHGVSHRRRVCTGETDRLALLRQYVPDFEPRSVRERLLRAYPRQPGLSGPVVGRDDIVDAVACLVTALRIVTRSQALYARRLRDRA